MKLAFCLFKYFPFGGLQRDFLRIAIEALRRGHSVDVFTMEWTGEKHPDLTLHFVPKKGLQNHTQNANFARQIQGQLHNYDLVVGFNKMPGLDVYYAADICYEAKTRHARRFWYQLTPRYRQLFALEKAVFGHQETTKILLISKRQQKEFTQCYKTQVDRFYLLPPGISKDRIAGENAEEIREQTRKELGVKEEDFLLLMVGSGFKTKGLDRILQGIAALSPELKVRTQLFIIGQDDPTKFQKIAKKLNIIQQCHFLGGRNDVPRFFIAADLLLHPAYHENTGTVLLEALAGGLPVLTTDVCGYADYIRTANAGMVLASPYQQSEFNRALESMLLSPLRETWRQNAIEFAKNADIYSMPERAVDFIASCHSLDRGNPFRMGPRDQGDDKGRGDDSRFTQMMSLQGEIYRQLEGRTTTRVILDNQAYFIKKHEGVGFKEIFKNLLQLRLPIVSAKNEWLALNFLKKLNIPVPEVIAYGKKGLNPASVKSFILTRELPKHISLEHFCKDWKTDPPGFQQKQRILKEVARISQVCHANGLNHRDFYICHFLLDLTLFDTSIIKLYLIDLHRACIRPEVPKRWLVKDLAGLYFSAKDIGLTKRDLLRFIKEYRNKSLTEIFPKELAFWRKVEQRGDKLYGMQEK